MYSNRSTSYTPGHRLSRVDATVQRLCHVIPSRTWPLLPKCTRTLTFQKCFGCGLCRDFATCITLRSVAFTTGSTTLPPSVARTPPPPKAMQVQMNATLVYTVDVSSYSGMPMIVGLFCLYIRSLLTLLHCSVFQLQIFVDRLVTLLLEPASGDR